MPIYAYKCQQCQFAKDVLQKIADPVLRVCPACGAEAFQKQLTAPGFQLKGSGWYATDFKSNGSPPTPKTETTTETTPTPTPTPTSGCGGGCACHPTTAS